MDGIPVCLCVCAVQLRRLVAHFQQQNSQNDRFGFQLWSLNEPNALQKNPTFKKQTSKQTGLAAARVNPILLQIPLCVWKSGCVCSCVFPHMWLKRLHMCVAGFVGVDEGI